jgi:hypothetical protein
VSLRDRYGLDPGDGIVNFGAPGGPPPGYLVVWRESDEHYRWVREGGEVWSDITSDRWAARRGAWAHHRAAETKEPPPPYKAAPGMAA